MSTVEHAVAIDAPPSAVWRVLTNRELVREWAAAIVDGIDLATKWVVGDAVLWKAPDGGPMLAGRVGAFEPERLLRFDYEGFSDSWQVQSDGQSVRLIFRRGPLAGDAGIAFDPVGREIAERIKSLAEELARLPRPWAKPTRTPRSRRGRR